MTAASKPRPLAIKIVSFQTNNPTPKLPRNTPIHRPSVY